MDEVLGHVVDDSMVRAEDGDDGDVLLVPKGTQSATLYDYYPWVRSV